MTSSSSSSDNNNSNNNTTSILTSVLSSIAPAMASTACCWGPALLSMAGAAAGSSSSSVVLLTQVSQYRPHLLAMSACMISYSFYKVYGPPSKISLSHQETENEHGCCKRLSTEDKAQHAQTLKRNRMIVWASLGVALAGASYGRFPAASSKTILQSSLDETKKNLMFFSELPTLSHLLTGSSSSKSPPTATSARKLWKGQDDDDTTATITTDAGTTAATDAVANKNAVVSWHVEGMHCGGCARNLQRILEGVEGVQSASVTFSTGSVVVQGLTGEEGWNEAAVRTAILNLGYTVSDDVDAQ